MSVCFMRIAMKNGKLHEKARGQALAENWQRSKNIFECQFWQGVALSAGSASFGSSML
ncbi:MAG: hypothetical protein GY820_30510 [Gammaproteobacteria bacterium]|nr:hypothetical protein [Gammaproteobacteria bacterium]